MTMLDIDNFRAQLEAAAAEFDRIHVAWSGDEFCIVTETKNYSCRAASWWYGLDDLDGQTAREFILGAAKDSLAAWGIPWEGQQP